MLKTVDSRPKKGNQHQQALPQRVRTKLSWLCMCGSASLEDEPGTNSEHPVEVCCGQPLSAADHAAETAQHKSGSLKLHQHQHVSQDVDMELQVQREAGCVLSRTSTNSSSLTVVPVHQAVSAHDAASMAGICPEAGIKLGQPPHAACAQSVMSDMNILPAFSVPTTQQHISGKLYKSSAQLYVDMMPCGQRQGQLVLGAGSSASSTPPMIPSSAVSGYSPLHAHGRHGAAPCSVQYDALVASASLAVSLARNIGGPSGRSLPLTKLKDPRAGATVANTVLLYMLNNDVTSNPAAKSRRYSFCTTSKPPNSSPASPYNPHSHQPLVLLPSTCTISHLQTPLQEPGPRASLDTNCPVRSDRGLQQPPGTIGNSSISGVSHSKP